MNATATSLDTNSSLTDKAFYKFLVPSIFSLLASSLSNLIDTLIIGNSLSAEALGAMSLVTPVYLVYFTIGSMIAVGSSIMASISLGRDKQKDANSYYSAAYISAIVFGVIMTVAGLVFLDPITKMLGADASNYEYTRDYIRYYIGGGLFTLLFYLPLNFLKIAGKPKLSMLLLMIMGGVNICLTLLFVRVFDMSTGGASLATVISLFVAFSAGFVIMHKNNNIKFCKPKLTKMQYGGIFVSGSAAALNNLSRAVSVIIINSVITLYASSRLLSLYTATRNVNDIILTVILGISQSIIPLVSLFFGERDNVHIEYAMKKAVRVGSVIVLALAVIMCLFGNLLIRFFGISDESLLGFDGRFAIICTACSLNFTFVNTLYSNYYSAVKIPSVSNFILLTRTISVSVTAFVIAKLVGGVYIWLCFPLSELLTLPAWIWYSAFVRKKNSRKKICLTKYYLLDEENNVKENGLDFSIDNSTESISKASEYVCDFLCDRGVPMKTGMLSGLCIEEMLVLVKEQQEKYGKAANGSDVRIFKVKDSMVMRIRYNGASFDPAEFYRKTEDKIMYPGMKMVLEKAQTVDYASRLGMNNLMIIL